MDYSIVVNALQLVVFLASLIICGVCLGALVSGVLRVVTQIDDRSIGFAGRFTGVVVALYFGSNYFSSEIFEFTARVWGGAEFYH